MRHKLKLFNLVLIVVFVFSFTACTTPKTAPETKTTETAITKTTAPETTVAETTILEKQYTVTVYTLNNKGKETVKFAKNEVGWSQEELIKRVLGGKTEYAPSDLFIIDIYSAKEIVDYSDNKVRFVNDKTNLEKFITADFIKVEQVK